MLIVFAVVPLKKNASINSEITPTIKGTTGAKSP